MPSSFSLWAISIQPRENETGQSGGIGAALSQYTLSHDIMTGGNDNISSRIRTLPLNPSDSIGSTRGTRIGSTGLLSGKGSQLHDFGARGMSPLLLPPAGISFGAADPPGDLIRADDRSLSSKLLPRDYRGLSSREGASSRSLNAVPNVKAQPSPLLSGDLFTDPVSFCAVISRVPHDALEMISCNIYSGMGCRWAMSRRLEQAQTWRALQE
jgi:hypothetical protein